MPFRYQELTSRYPNHTPRPIIGISGNFSEKGLELAEGYYRSVCAAGGSAVALPPIESVIFLAPISRAAQIASPRP